MRTLALICSASFDPKGAESSYEYLKPKRWCGVPVILSTNGKLDAEFGISHSVYHVRVDSEGRNKRVSCSEGSVTMLFYPPVRYEGCHIFLKLSRLG